MKWIVHDGSGQLRVEGDAGVGARRMGARGENVEDGAQGGALDWVKLLAEQRGVHELLFDPGMGHFSPGWLGMLVAHRAAKGTGQVVWCDPYRLMYPIAWEGVGGTLKQLCVVRPSPQRDEVIWTVSECLGCAGVAATVANVPSKLTQVEARRLQLAAERGGGVAVLLRPKGQGSGIYAAATRWLVSPAPPSEGNEGRALGGTVQGWQVELLHGHGRSVQRYLVERRRAIPSGFGIEQGETREENPLYFSSVLGDRAAVAAGEARAAIVGA